MIEYITSALFIFMPHHNHLLFDLAQVICVFESVENCGSEVIFVWDKEERELIGSRVTALALEESVLQDNVVLVEIEISIEFNLKLLKRLKTGFSKGMSLVKVSLNERDQVVFAACR